MFVTRPIRHAAFLSLPYTRSEFNSKSLFDHLSDLVSRTHKPLDYDPKQYLYPTVDRHPDNNLYCIYSDGGPGNTNVSEPPMKGGYNCEHVVPQSWFQKKSAPRGDLHHLFASEEHCNSVRGNALYMETENTQGFNMAKHGGTDVGDNRFVPQGGKGEVARATLYFLMRYPGMVGDSPSEYSAKDIPLLIQWSKEDPPSQYEFHRNQTIQQMQGNRNPLTDFPELVDKIDFTRGLGRPRA